MKELEKLSDEALDHRLHYVHGLCPEGIAVIVPRYTADLNECAKVIQGLNSIQLSLMRENLIYICDLNDRSRHGYTPMHQRFWHAEAREVAIALIATLESK